MGVAGRRRLVAQPGGLTSVSSPLLISRFFPLPSPLLSSSPFPFFFFPSLPYFYIFVSLSPSLFYMEYMEKLTNEENEWDHKISAGVKEGPADCVRIAEVTAVLKKMNSLIIPW